MTAPPMSEEERRCARQQLYRDVLGPLYSLSTAGTNPGECYRSAAGGVYLVDHLRRRACLALSDANLAQLVQERQSAATAAGESKASTAAPPPHAGRRRTRGELEEEDGEGEKKRREEERQARGAVAAPSPAADRGETAEPASVVGPVDFSTFPKQLVAALEPTAGALLWIFCGVCKVFVQPGQVALHRSMPMHKHGIGAVMDLTGFKARTPAKALSLLAADRSEMPKVNRLQSAKMVTDLPQFVTPSVAMKPIKNCEFFDEGFDVVTAVCTICNKNMDLNNLKAHEKSAMHRSAKIQLKEVQNL